MKCEEAVRWSLRERATGSRRFVCVCVPAGDCSVMYNAAESRTGPDSESLSGKLCLQDRFLDAGSNDSDISMFDLYWALSLIPKMTLVMP